MRVPWTARRSNQSILKEVNLEYLLEGLMLKLKLQYSDHLMGRPNSLEKTLMLGKIEDERRRGQQMVGWHHQLNGHEFEQTPGDNEGQGSLVCCGPRGHRIGHNLMTEHKGSQVAQWLKKKKEKNWPARCRFNYWIGKCPCRRAWQPTPIFLPGKSHGQRSLAGYSP